MKNVRIVSENDAMINSYIHQNHLALDHLNESKNIVFIDIGHSKTAFYCVRFESNGLPELVYKDFDTNLGGRNLDLALMDEISRHFKNH